MEYTEKHYTGTRIKSILPYFCGRRLNAPNHRFRPTERSHFWMIYLKEGNGFFSMSGHTHRLKKGDFFVAYPNRSIQYGADAGDVWSIYWIALDEVTNVYTLGAMAFALFANSRRNRDSWPLGDRLYRVACTAVQNDRALRQQSIQQFMEEWDAALRPD